jgi:hypothetical protein
MLGTWVRNAVTGETKWEYYVGEYIWEESMVVDQDGCELPWGLEDFERWCELPIPPKDEESAK